VLRVGLLSLVLGLVLLPGTAGAGPNLAAAPQQSCDQAYGCPTSTTEEAVNPSCSIVPESAEAGSTVTGTLKNVPIGTEVSLLFDGDVVAKKTATADGQGQQALGIGGRSAGHLSVAALAVTATGGAVISFIVPGSASAGTHTVVFSGAGFSCDPTFGKGFAVLGASTTRRPGSVARTGIEVAMYLAVALALIVAGWQLARFARARQRRIARQNRVHARQHVPR
jgi:hypothetical protein